LYGKYESLYISVMTDITIIPKNNDNKNI
jgi:hypothetical protein